MELLTETDRSVSVSDPLPNERYCRGTPWLFVCSTLLQNAILTREKIKPEQSESLTTVNPATPFGNPGVL